jgi:hypothetical protein
MAPAVAHFLVGAAILLLVAAPFCLRYQVDREYGLVLVPVGGLWGITPDFHNIAPIGTAALYRFHNSPWVDLFGLHYTLDFPGLLHEAKDTVLTPTTYRRSAP